MCKIIELRELFDMVRMTNEELHEYEADFMEDKLKELIGKAVFISFARGGKIEGSSLVEYKRGENNTWDITIKTSMGEVEHHTLSKGDGITVVRKDNKLKTPKRN